MIRSRGIQSLPFTSKVSVDGPKAVPDQQLRRKISKFSRTRGKTVSLTVMAFLIGVCIYCFRNKYFPVLHQTQSSVDNNSLSCINNTVVEDLYQQLQENQEATEQLESFYESRLNELRQKIDVYQRSLENEPIQNESTEKTMNLENKLKNLEKNHGLVVQQNSQLKSFIAQTDKKRILDKYGPGPHHVEFLLDFPPNNTPPGSESMFVIEMAPFNLMPHTVYLFLEQVTHGLFNGTSFYRNAGHVVQGGPVPYYKNQGEGLMKRFRDLDLESVAFQEYHKDFPHIKYTLGYAGRPGGPDFYVSTIDNTLNHGPGGQTDYALSDEADPCFAKIIQGFAAVDRMALMPVQKGAFRAMKDNVGIVYARLLTSTVQP